MQDRLDPLIAERAPWLFRQGFSARAARHIMHQLLSYNKTLELAQRFREADPEDLMAQMGDMLARDVQISGLENIPRQGSALVIANHPTGIADGIMLHRFISDVRPDLFIYANSDILRVLPQMSKLILPVEWREEKRTHAKTRETMAQTREAVDSGRLGVIFPSGRLAKRRGLRLFERNWMASAATIARKFDLPVIPVNIRARNSALFYLFDMLHPTLRDVTLFHETLNKGKQPYVIRVGEAISAHALPPQSAEAIDMLKRATLALGEADKSGVSLVEMTRMSRWV